LTDKVKGGSEKRRTLYVGLIVYTLIGISIGVLAFFTIRLGANYYIETHYLSEERRVARVEAYAKELQEFATKNDLSSEDTDMIALWAKENPYVYLMVYKDDELFFSSDMNEENKNDPGEEEGDGSSTDKDTDKDNTLSGISSKVDRDKLIAQAKANGMHPIELSDGTIFAAIAEFSEELYYTISTILSVSVGIIILAIILVLYFRKIIIRIKRLEKDVNIVSHINMSHRITCTGNDEISTLSRNVEDMRHSILDNLEKERAARTANTELITAMSHDIRTPLTVLLGYIEMLKNYEGCDETVKSYVGATESTAMRLKELADDMFKYSLDFGVADSEIALEEYDAKVLMEQMLYEHLILLSESGYEVRFGKDFDSVGEGRLVLTDPQKLMRIIDNVFQNLYKYADKSEPVECLMEIENGLMVFVCRNKILDEPTDAESNGIGLKNCKKLAKHLAGGFSYSGEGGYFTVRLSLKLK